MSDESVVGEVKRGPGMLLPKDLDDWVLVRTTGGERFLGRIASWPAVHGEPVTLVRAYEYLQQVRIQAGNIGPPTRLLVPLEFLSDHESITLNPSAVVSLREAGDAERRMWLALIEQAEKIRREISLSQRGFVAGTESDLRNLVNGSART